MFDAIPDCSDCGPSLEDEFPIASKWRRRIIQGEYLHKEKYSIKINIKEIKKSPDNR
jgi:hypothetical protein